MPTMASSSTPAPTSPAWIHRLRREPRSHRPAQRSCHALPPQRQQPKPPAPTAGQAYGQFMSDDVQGEDEDLATYNRWKEITGDGDVYPGPVEVWKHWHRDQSLYREVYVRTLSALIAAAIIYVIAGLLGVVNTKPALWFAVAASTVTALITIWVGRHFFNFKREHYLDAWPSGAWVMFGLTVVFASGTVGLLVRAWVT